MVWFCAIVGIVLKVSAVVAAIFAALLAAFKVYYKLVTGWCYSYTCLDGKTVIVTGANAGIGYYAALDFAKRGARVILACRDQHRAEEARKKIVEATGNANVVVKIVDMASFESVRAFAKDINATEERLDILVNNAGGLGVEDKKTQDKIHVTMQVNHFSSFLLTMLLIDLLKRSGPSRIVNVSSIAAVFAKIDVNSLAEYPGKRASYRNSKLCNILFTQELAKKLRGSNVTVYSTHPGLVSTEIFRDSFAYFIAILRNTIMKTTEEGAQTTIYTAVEKGIEKYSGEHFVDCKRVAPYKSARDDGLAKKVWEKSEIIVKLKPEETKI